MDRAPAIVSRRCRESIAFTLPVRGCFNVLHTDETIDSMTV
jgi:hypothetical protein